MTSVASSRTQLMTGHVTSGRGGRVETSRMKCFHVSRHVEIMRRDFVVPILIFSVPFGPRKPPELRVD